MKKIAFIVFTLVLSYSFLNFETTLAIQETNQKKSHYTDFPVDYKLPSSDAEKIKQCQWVRNEIARVQSVMDAASSMLESTTEQTLIRVIARKNLAWLNGRASALKCNSSFSPHADDSIQDEFDDCYNKCLKYTDYNKNECFDKCNR